MYHVTKRYGHELGLSAVFRQPKADSHCRFLHGYALAFTVTFAAEKLNERNWVIDFGKLGELKRKLQQWFDHKILIASDDPHAQSIVDYMHAKELGEVVIVPAVGCEMFARLVFQEARLLLIKEGESKRVWVESVTCSEHGANSATYIGAMRGSYECDDYADRLVRHEAHILKEASK